MTEAEFFVTLMEGLWDDSLESNARFYAERRGAVRLYTSRSRGDYGYTYEFIDGSRVWISTSGGIVKEIQVQGKETY